MSRKKYLRCNLRGCRPYSGIQDNNYRLLGFARIYGKKDIGEDKATIAELLMTSPTETRKCAQEDRVFRKKVASVMSLFEKRSKGLMNYKWFEEAVKSGQFLPWSKNQ